MTTAGTGSQAPCVLVVDDEEDIRSMIRLALELKGYWVVEASDGEDALRQLREGTRPGLILLDLMMPGLNGWDFRDQQLKDPELAEIPVLVFTGDTRITQKVLELGAAGYVKKPVGFHSLQAVVEKHLEPAAEEETGP